VFTGNAFQFTRVHGRMSAKMWMSLSDLEIKRRCEESSGRQALIGVGASFVRDRQTSEVCFHLILAFFSAIAMLACVGNAQAPRDGTSAITGAVHDNSGNAVGEATVRLQAQGNGQAEERKTDGSGSFGFAGLRAGTYVLSASKGERHSSEVTVSLTKGGAIQRVELTLSGPDGGGREPQMEYSDAPNFTVAAVTDWTAAGGHGSDASLRTSEALNRETLRLKAAADRAQGTDGAEREENLRADLEKSPGDLKVNEDLGRFYLAAERYSDAVPPLRTAFELDESNEENEYDLAVALVRSGDVASAREHLNRLRSKKKTDRPEWHRLAGEIAEKSGEPLDAVHEFEQAAKAEPSEENYFAWGSELLKHRAVLQAKEVFESGTQAHPKSARMLTALGAALFAGARYEEAARRLCDASDLNPAEVEPYLFMGEVEIAAPNSLTCIEPKLQRFVQMQPADATANLYYAMAYWKEHGKRVDEETSAIVERYLDKATKADPKCSEAYLQLGILRASRTDFGAASGFYQKAIDADPQSSEAHYRLGVAYDRLGAKEKAAEEFRLHDELEKRQAAAIDQQRREVKQFLVKAGGDNGEHSANP
jgi:Flp pilus assembly protein TadD